MGIYLPNMEMPKNCKACVCLNYYDRMDMFMCDITNEPIDEKQWKRERHPNCPLIELPPHGRLIDIKSVKDGKFVTVDNDYQRWWNGALESVIDNAPTVIEGSET